MSIAGGENNFAAVLRERRLAANLTQAALAEQAGISARAVQDLERGLSQPHRDTLTRLTDVLGFSPQDRSAFASGRKPGPRPRKLDTQDVYSSDEPATGSGRQRLPLQVTSFIGRERELAEVRRLLGITRLLTLVGAGGVGKTRLALETAGYLVGEYPDGVWLIELAALADATMVPHALANSLGLREQYGRSMLETVTSFLERRRALLVIDNCEHVLESCRQVADAVLRSSAGTRVLATSRQPLGIAGETTWFVPSLSVPHETHPFSEDLGHYDGVRLFLDRATAAQPNFALTLDTAQALVRVCRRLDGIPLALELAAVCVRGLSIDVLAERLDQRFRLLVGGNASALPRQRTLRATIDWSYELLNEQERLLFARLSVFVGGWSLQAAEAVCAGSGIATDGVVDLFLGLIDKSLVVADIPGSVATEPVGATTPPGGRYRLLETLRQYGSEQLEACGEADLTRHRHAAYYAELVIQAEPQLNGPYQGRWFAHLALEQDNIRAALRWLVEEARDGARPGARHATELGLQACAALHGFWYQRGQTVEGHDHLMALLETAGGVPGTRARALNAAGWLAHYRGDFSGAQMLLEGARTIFEAGGDTLGAAWSRAYLGTARFRQGHWSAARADLEASLAVFRSVGDLRGTAASLGVLGALLRWSGADAEQADDFVQESLELDRALGNQEGVCRDLFLVGQFAILGGNDAAAWAPLAESLEIATAGGYLYWLAYLLECFAHLVAHDDPTRALLLAGAASALREREGAPSSPFWGSWFERELASIRQILKDPRSDEVLAAGRTLSLTQATAMALAVDAIGPGMGSPWLTSRVPA